MYSDSSNLIKKFEKMISDDSSIFLDTDEVEEIILYYFNEGDIKMAEKAVELGNNCLLYTSPSPRDKRLSRMPSSA